MTEQSMEDTTIGRIKWFNNKKGFGFLSNCATNEDIFIHHSGIKLNESTLSSDVNIFKTVIEGEYVSYQTKKDNENRTVAKNVTGVFGGPLLCENVSKKIFISNRTPNHTSGDEGRSSTGTKRTHRTAPTTTTTTTTTVPNVNIGDDGNAFSTLAEE